MTAQNDIPTFPVAAWDLGPVPSLEMIVFRPHFLASPMQKMDEATPSKYYALNPKQALQLAEDLKRAVQKLESVGFQPPPSPKQ